MAFYAVRGRKVCKPSLIFGIPEQQPQLTPPPTESMEHYCKGKNVEEPLQRDTIPIPNLPENFLWMTVSAGSKIQHLLRSALAEFPKHRAVVWSGSGPAVGKVVSCAEIMKKKHRGSLHQLNRICYRTVEEYWDPLLENIDQLVVKRRLPVIHILLSMDALPEAEPGYQPPGTTIARDLQALNMNRQPEFQAESGVSVKK